MLIRLFLFLDKHNAIVKQYNSFRQNFATNTALLMF